MKPTFKAKSQKKASAKSKSTSPAKSMIPSLARKLPFSTKDMSLWFPLHLLSQMTINHYHNFSPSTHLPLPCKQAPCPSNMGNASLASETQRLLNVPSLSASASSPANGHSKFVLTLSLAKVKIENLMPSAAIGPAMPASALGDGKKQELGWGKLTHAKKKLFSA